MSRTIPPLKTYSHLAGAKRVPTEYEIVTSKLLYYVERGFEVDVPVAGFYRRFQAGSPFNGAAWERFTDPRETTYTTYTELQARQEAHLAALWQALEAPEHAAQEHALAGLEATLGPWRFAVHGLQMIAAHVGHLAPAGRIAVVALFQAADELRRVHAVAYRMGQLRHRHPGFGARSRALWQGDPAWQPLRRLIETCLVAYDWGESLCALNLCLKPMLDNLFNTELGRRERARGAFPWGSVLASLDEDAGWHRAWTGALLEVAFADRPENRAVAQGWVDRWWPPAYEAAATLATALWPEDAPSMLGAAAGAALAWQRQLGLPPR